MASKRLPTMRRKLTGKDGGLDPSDTRRMDPAGIPALLQAIRHLHGLDAIWIDTVPVHEKHEGKTVWEGHVQVFAVDHPKASRVYAWSHETDGGKRRFHAVLGASPVDSAEMAVRTTVLTSVTDRSNP